MSEPDSLHDFVVQKLRGMIIDGKLKPGALIDEMAFGAKLGVSRSPVREALKVLRAERIVEFRPRQGARVIQLTPRAVRDLYEVLANLEATAVRLVCDRASDTAIREMIDLNEAMRMHFERRNLRLYMAANQEIHERLVAASANLVLEEVYSRVTTRARMARFGVEMTAERWAQAMQEHDKLAEALTRRAGAEAAKIVHDHAVAVSEVLCRQLERNFLHAEAGPDQPGVAEQR
jgi:DNA-binding GntR family transcriptional regulator